MKRFYFLSLAIFLALTHFSIANNALQVIDPANTQSAWWFGGWGWSPNFPQNGTIEEYNLSVTPKGLYTEIGVTFEVNTNGDFPDGLAVEVILDFELPKGAFITDSWLWIEDTIIQAAIWDRWVANQVYESIVDRPIPEDPSILYKLTETQYQLRIYPMFIPESRKVKITYSVPTQWGQDQVVSSLPINILKSADVLPDSIGIFLDHSETWSNPSLIGLPNHSFVTYNDEENNLIDFVRIPTNELGHTLRLKTDAPYNQQGLYFNTSSVDDEHFYELAIHPAYTETTTSNNRLMIAVNHLTNNSDLTIQEIRDNISNLVNEYSNSIDYVNFIYNKSNQTIGLASDDWIPIAEANSYIDNINLSNLTSAFYQDTFLESVYEYMEEQNQGGEVLLLSNTILSFSEEAAIAMAENLISLVDEYEIPTHVYNYNNHFYAWIDVGGNSSRPDHYIFSQLTSHSKATYEKDNLFSNFIGFGGNIIENLGEKIELFDINILPNNGFTYQNYFTNSSSLSQLNANKPILQTGKYIGDFPIELSFDAIHQEVYIDENFTITEASSFENNYISTSWEGRKLLDWEIYHNSNNQNEIWDIIDFSIDRRILSIYTAFIALEPSLGGEPCVTCVDVPTLPTFAIQTGVENPSIPELSDNFSIAPNPFETQTTIRVPKESKEFTVEIFDAKGHLVLQLSAVDFNNHQFIWNGNNHNQSDLPIGIYFVRYSDGQKAFTRKLIKQ